MINLGNVTGKKKQNTIQNGHIFQTIYIEYLQVGAPDQENQMQCLI